MAWTSFERYGGGCPLPVQCRLANAAKAGLVPAPIASVLGRASPAREDHNPLAADSESENDRPGILFCNPLNISLLLMRRLQRQQSSGNDNKIGSSTMINALKSVAALSILTATVLFALAPTAFSQQPTD